MLRDLDAPQMTVLDDYTMWRTRALKAEAEVRILKLDVNTVIDQAIAKLEELRT